jgi:hypothetical protein
MRASTLEVKAVTVLSSCGLVHAIGEGVCLPDSTNQ